MRGSGRGRGQKRALTDVNVPGRNTIVNKAIPFIDELSRFISFAIPMLFAASC